MMPITLHGGLVEAGPLSATMYSDLAHDVDLATMGAPEFVFAGTVAGVSAGAVVAMRGGQLVRVAAQNLIIHEADGGVRMLTLPTSRGVHKVGDLVRVFVSRSGRGGHVLTLNALPAIA